jgi:CHAD domain-containing protein
VLIAALKAQGRFPGDYSTKLDIPLEPHTPAHKAVKAIYKQLLQVIKLNEQDAINATDTEFLHDFRVAVRRTRAGLNQFKAVSPADVSSRYAAYFAWLGQITSPTRDLDVYLLNSAHYKASLPAEMRDDLEPLREFLQLKQKAAQKELATQLKSKQYLTTLIDWEQYLQKAVEPTENSKVSIKQFADTRIWKIYQRVIKQGSAINPQSPAIELHELRKTCKKLRYLIEFFQNLYPAAEIRILLKSLKELQELLGDFQDSAVQEQALQQFKTEMMQNNYPEQTFVAIEALVQILETKRYQARNHFSKRYAVFVAARNRTLFKSLFVGKF